MSYRQKKKKHINISFKSPDPGERRDMQAKRDTNLTNSEKCTDLRRIKCMHLNVANYIVNSHGWESINLALITSYLCDLYVTSHRSPNYDFLICRIAMRHPSASWAFVNVRRDNEGQMLCVPPCALPSSVCIKDPSFIRACKYVGDCFLFSITYCSQNITFII